MRSLDEHPVGSLASKLADDCQKESLSGFSSSRAEWEEMRADPGRAGSPGSAASSWRLIHFSH